MNPICKVIEQVNRFLNSPLQPDHAEHKTHLITAVSLYPAYAHGLM